MDGLSEGDEEVGDAKAGNGSLEVGIVPEGGGGREKSPEVIEMPGIYPRKHGKEQADFQSEEDKTDGPEAIRSHLGRCGGICGSSEGRVPRRRLGAICGA